MLSSLRQELSHQEPHRRVHRHGTDLLQVPAAQSEAAARRQHLGHGNMLLKMSYQKFN